MRAPVLRRVANPLSIWIAMLAIVLQSVMPMAAQARMRMMAAEEAAASAATHACDEMTALSGSEAPVHAGMAASHDSGAAAVHAQPVADATPAGKPPVNPHAMHGDAPCPYCRVHLDAVALPPIPNPHWVLLVSAVPRPVADEAIPVPAEPWSPTRQRGPPLIA